MNIIKREEWKMYNTLVFLVIFGKRHYLIYSLAAAMQPRWLMTLDENMEQISVPVRVGQVIIYFQI